MRIQTAGNPNNPVIVMLPGSFCRSELLKYLYKRLEDEYFIVLPDYNGHYAGSTFTTRQKEAEGVEDYLLESGFTQIRMLYGQSMGAEVAIELLRQLQEKNITVEHSFMDGAPCINMSPLRRKAMYFMFKKAVDMVRKKDVNHLLNSSLVQSYSDGDPEKLRPAAEIFSDTAEILTNETIKREVECCYTFDFPQFNEAVQKTMHFFYGREEKAYKLCCQGLKQAYPMAEYTIVDGVGHMSYSIKKTDAYIERLKFICEQA